MNCAQCSAELVEGAQFCPGCGTRVVASSPLSEVAVSSPPPAAAPSLGPQPAVQAPAIKTVSGLYIAYLACAALLIVSALLPWEKVSVSGIEVESANGFGVVRGWLVFIAAGAAAGVVVASMSRIEPIRWLRLAQFGSAGVAISMAVLEFGLVGNRSCTGNELICQEYTAGIGALSALLGGVVLAAIALFKGGSVAKPSVTSGEAA